MPPAVEPHRGVTLVVVALVEAEVLGAVGAHSVLLAQHGQAGGRHILSDNTNANANANADPDLHDPEHESARGHAEGTVPAGARERAAPVGTCVFASERQMLRPHEWIESVKAAESEMHVKSVVQKLQVSCVILLFLTRQHI